LDNPAKGLYEKLGFTNIPRNASYQIVQMENLKQGVAPLIYCVRNCINIEVSGKEVGNCKVSHFLEKISADEIITNIGETGIIAIYNGETRENNLHLDVS
jgi:hypothetical protein